MTRGNSSWLFMGCAIGILGILGIQLVIDYIRAREVAPLVEAAQLAYQEADIGLDVYVDQTQLVSVGGKTFSCEVVNIHLKNIATLLVQYDNARFVANRCKDDWPNCARWSSQSEKAIGILKSERASVQRLGCIADCPNMCPGQFTRWALWGDALRDSKDCNSVHLQIPVEK